MKIIFRKMFLYNIRIMYEVSLVPWSYCHSQETSIDVYYENILNWIYKVSDT